MWFQSEVYRLHHSHVEDGVESQEFSKMK